MWTLQCLCCRKRRTDVNTKRLTWLSLLVSASLLLSYVEFLLPMPLAWPGMKIGLANVLVMLTLYRMGLVNALVVAVMRVGLSSLLFGTPLSFAYALAGSICSVLLMALLLRMGKFSLWAVSMAGAVLHNTAQVAVAMIVFAQSAVLSFLPPLMLWGVVSGLVVGIIAYLAHKKIPEKLFPSGFHSSK